MKRIWSLMLAFSLLLLLTSCSGTKIIEGELYVTGIGLDLKDGKFKLYIQGLNFGNIAKQEGAALQELPALIGEAEGESILAALSVLEQNSAMPISLGHVATLLVSKSVMEEKMDEVIELIGQAPLLRYNMLLFGTEEDMKDLFQSQSFFNFSPLYTVIHRPDRIMEGNYVLPDLRFNQFVSRYYRPVGTIMIPSLKLSENHFTEESDKKVATVNGGYILSDKKFKGWLSKEELAGVKWLTEGVHRTTILLGNEKMTVKINKTKHSVSVMNSKKPAYRISVKGKAMLINNLDNQKIGDLEKELNELVKKEILTTVKKGSQIHADVLNISEKSYKYYLKNWDVKTIGAFDEASIKDVKVMVHIEEAGGYKE